jgi:hypothetical protein
MCPPVNWKWVRDEYGRCTDFIECCNPWHELVAASLPVDQGAAMSQLPEVTNEDVRPEQPPEDAPTSYSTNLAPVYIAEQIFFHVLLKGGDGNPFRSIRNQWFVELAAPKIRELLTASENRGAAQPDEWKGWSKGLWVMLPEGTKAGCEKCKQLVKGGYWQVDGCHFCADCFGRCMEIGKKLARELRRRCNTKLSLLHQSAWYEACNELETFADSVFVTQPDLEAIALKNFPPLIVKPMKQGTVATGFVGHDFNEDGRNACLAAMREAFDERGVYIHSAQASEGSVEADTDLASVRKSLSFQFERAELLAGELAQVKAELSRKPTSEGSAELTVDEVLRGVAHLRSELEKAEAAVADSQAEAKELREALLEILAETKQGVRPKHDKLCHIVVHIQKLAESVLKRREGAKK